MERRAAERPPSQRRVHACASQTAQCGIPAESSPPHIFTNYNRSFEMQIFPNTSGIRINIPSAFPIVPQRFTPLNHLDWIEGKKYLYIYRSCVCVRMRCHCIKYIFNIITRGGNVAVPCYVRPVGAVSFMA